MSGFSFIIKGNRFLTRMRGLKRSTRSEVLHIKINVASQLRGDIFSKLSYTFNNH